MVHGLAPRAVPVACESRRGRTVSFTLWEVADQDKPGCDVDDQGRLDVRAGACDTAAPAVRRRLHEHRLRALHHGPALSRGSPFGALARPEARVWHPHPAGSRLTTQLLEVPGASFLGPGA